MEPAPAMNFPPCGSVGTDWAGSGEQKLINHANVARVENVGRSMEKRCRFAGRSRVIGKRTRFRRPPNMEGEMYKKNMPLMSKNAN